MQHTNKQFIILAAFALMLFASGVKAQFVWQLSQPEENTVRYQYTIRPISCSGDNCMAAGKMLDYITQKSSLIFWRSSDGGRTWKIQDPDLPPPGNNLFYYGQEIDSLDAVAIGDTGLVVRTFDGGETWEKQDCHSKSMLEAVHFSDPLNGIIISSDSVGNVLTTSDGGNHWNVAPFGGLNLYQCHAFGSGNFSVMKYGVGPIYITHDNWNTVDSTKPFFDSPVSQEYLFFRWSIVGNDTIFIYGEDVDSIQGIIARSTDGGSTWGKVFSFRGFNYINAMTAINKDTIFAGGLTSNRILFSSDRGESWINDSLILNTTYQADVCYALTSAADGHYAGSFFNSGIIILQNDLMQVNMPDPSSQSISIYPNPASSEMTIITPILSGKASIIDLLGREAEEGMITQGKSSFDVSMLPPGFYSVLLNRNGNSIPFGNFVIRR